MDSAGGQRKYNWFTATYAPQCQACDGKPCGEVYSSRQLIEPGGKKLFSSSSIFLRIFTYLKKYVIVFPNGHLKYKRDKYMRYYVFFCFLCYCAIFIALSFLRSLVQSILPHIQIFLVIYRWQHSHTTPPVTNNHFWTESFFNRFCGGYLLENCY